MTLSVQSITQTSVSEISSLWHQLLSVRKHHSFFETPEWVAFLLRCLPNTNDQTRLICFSDHTQAILPLIASPKRLGFQKLESLPWGCYGGLISNTTLSPEYLKLVAKKILSLKYPLLEITPNPLSPICHAANATIVNKETSILKLNNFETLWQNIQARTRTAIRKAEAEGLTVEHGFSEPLIQSFHQLYQQSCEDWSGVETLPDGFFQTLPTLNQDQASIWVAWYHSQPIAVDLILLGKGEAQYFAGASDRKLSKLQAPKLLMSEILKYCCDNHYHYFNFGASGGLPGVAQFKRHFGASQLPYVTQRYKHSLLSLFG